MSDTTGHGILPRIGPPREARATGRPRAVAGVVLSHATHSVSDRPERVEEGQEGEADPANELPGLGFAVTTEEEDPNSDGGVREGLAADNGVAYGGIQRSDAVADEGEATEHSPEAGWPEGGARRKKPKGFVGVKPSNRSEASFLAQTLDRRLEQAMPNRFPAD